MERVHVFEEGFQTAAPKPLRSRGQTVDPLEVESSTVVVACACGRNKTELKPAISSRREADARSLFLKY